MNKKTIVRVLATNENFIYFKQTNNTRNVETRDENTYSTYKTDEKPGENILIIPKYFVGIFIIICSRLKTVTDFRYLKIE